MTVKITHKFVSGKAQGPDPDKVYGPQWDADHTVSGLEYVDNTSDADKPVSSATQLALDGKVSGPASTSDGNFAVFDGATGKLIKGLTADEMPFIGGTTTNGVSAPTNILDARRSGDNILFGHTTDPYKSSFGAESSNGTPFTAYNAEAGTNANTYKTNGLKGSVVRPDNAGGFIFDTVPNANADNQALTRLGNLDANGNFFTIGSHGSGVVVNVKDPTFGAVGDGITDDSAAMANAAGVAVTVKGRLYFPPGVYRGKLEIQDASYLEIYCDAPRGATIRPLTSGQHALNVYSNAFSGGSTHICIRNMEFMAQAGQSNADEVLRIWNVLHFSLYDVFCFGTTTIQGSGFGTIVNPYFLGNPGLFIGDGGETLTNSGPLTFVGGEYVGALGGEGIRIEGDPLGLTFLAAMYQATAADYSVTLNGHSTGTPCGSVTFIDCHGESNWNTANDGSDIVIGNVHKFGHVGFYGGNFWGHGDGTNYRRYWLRIYAARDVIVDGVVLSNQGQTGYSSAGIRMEATFPASGDTYNFRNIIADITGLKISDANAYLPSNTGFASNQDSQAISRFNRGHIIGLTLSTAGSSSTFSIAAGEAVNSTGTDMMVRTASLNKTTSAWAVGSGNGSLDTGTIANSTWYHVHLIKRPGTGVVDALISLSATAPTLPGFYTLFRRIGSIKTDGSGNWTKFVQDGDTFSWDVPVTDVNATNPGTSAVSRTLTVPTGINVTAVFHGRSAMTSTTACATRFSDLATADTTPDFTNSQQIGNTTLSPTTSMQIKTNTSAQIRTRLSASAADVTLTVVTEGWIDGRGKSA